ncbi:MAG TPA: PaaI family thioesterase [Candidatus Binataceae bacterium]|nr:PaaI family thioesterase [Candidatus Binataceae bacterium]
MSEVYHRFPALKQLTEGAFSALLGLTVESASEGAVTVRMPFHPRLLNYGPPDVPIHGGAIASLADFAACAAVWTLPQSQRSATISMTVNYTAPGAQSDLIAEATVRRSGKRIASISVEIRDRDRELIADALVTYKIA